MPETDETTPETQLVECEITGKMVPEDETVVIQGHRVSAEGKAELMERLRSGELAPGELERPSVLRRFACLFVDGVILALLSIGVGMVVGILAGVGLATVNEPDPATPAAAEPEVLAVELVAGLIATVVGILYYTLLHARGGQTLGKMAGKIKVVDPDGSDIDMMTAFLRAIFYTGPNLLLVIPLVMVAASPQLTVGAYALINIFIALYGLVNIILALVDQKRQRALHDRLADTRVIVVD